MKTAVAKSQMVNLLKQYGVGSLSYSSLQSGVDTFMDEGKGFVPFGMVHCTKATPVSLSDPICAAENREELIANFIEKYRNPIFVHISQDVARVVEKHGYYVNEMGVETIVDVQRFSLSGPKKEFLRSQRNRAKRDGVEVHEYSIHELNKAELDDISNRWLNDKTSPGELAFLARPAVFEDEMDVRKFYAKKNGTLVGFVYFDPMYENGKVYGYIANILRADHASYSICDAIILEAIKVFKEEGIRELSLGFSPFCEVNDQPDFHYSKKKNVIFKWLFEHGNHIYKFKALAFHKKMYRPGIDGTREVKVYCASRTSLPVLCFYGLLMKMGLRPITQTVRFACNKTKATIDHAAKRISNAFEAVDRAFERAFENLHLHTPVHAGAPYPVAVLCADEDD